MTSKMQKKSYYVSPEFADKIEAEAKAQGISVSAYALQCIEAQLEQNGVSHDTVDDRMSDIICATTDKGFGEEHILERIDRRCHMIQSLCASIISEMNGNERAALIATLLKEKMLSEKNAA